MICHPEPAKHGEGPRKRPGVVSKTSLTNACEVLRTAQDDKSGGGAGGWARCNLKRASNLPRLCARQQARQAEVRFSRRVRGKSRRQFGQT